MKELDVVVSPPAFLWEPNLTLTHVTFDLIKHRITLHLDLAFQGHGEGHLRAGDDLDTKVISKSIVIPLKQLPHCFKLLPRS